LCETGVSRMDDPGIAALSRSYINSMSDENIALIIGITGQDGSYLSDLLLSKCYAVHGVVRRTSNLLRSRIEHLDASLFAPTLQRCNFLTNE
jgi:hypothetical protein